MGRPELENDPRFATPAGRRENWSELLERFHAVEASEEPADEKLRGIAKILLRTWRNDPALVGSIPRSSSARSCCG